jgi:glutamate---cysteine ligase / carboxylate-amine ligase
MDPSSATPAEPLTEVRWRELFDAAADHTLGVEEELMLLDPDTLDLLPEAGRAVAAMGEHGGVRTELPAAQVEIVTRVHDSVPSAIGAVATTRRGLAAAVAPWARLAGSGTHPFADPRGVLRATPRYERLAEEYRWALEQQLVFGLHVHVGVRGADRALAVFNALRSHLPELAALAGNAPLHAGRDTGLASLRPKITEMLPRQGLPPAFASWRALADFCTWVEPSAGDVWWEVRPHSTFGTLEIRVPDTQSTLQETAGVVALAAGLVAWLAERHDAGETLPVHETARIAENRWRALRHGLQGELLDLDSGMPVPTRERVHRLIEAVAPAAERLGGAEAIGHARTLAVHNGAERQRELAAEGGMRGVVEWLAEAFAP